MGGIVSSVTNLVSDAVETVGNVAEDVGSFVVETVDNTVTAIKEDPLKAAAVAAAAVATGGTSLAATLGTAGAAAAGAAAASTAIDLSRGEDLDDALKSGAIAGGAAYVGGSLLGGSGAGTDYLGSQALGDAATGAVGTGATGIGINAGASGIGINAGTGSLLGSTLEMGSALPTLAPDTGFGLNPAPSTTEFGTFNPSTVSPPSIDTSSLGSMEYLGGSTTLPAGTAGLTAEQIAASGTIGNVGANASSGLGYLGGSESLPTGTAGIQGVAAPTSLNLGDIQRGMRLANTLFGQQQPIPQQGFAPRQIKPAGVVDYSPILSLLQQRASTPNIYSLLG
jgi:hypothetical protein